MKEGSRGGSDRNIIIHRECEDSTSRRGAAKNGLSTCARLWDGQEKESWVDGEQRTRRERTALRGVESGSDGRPRAIDRLRGVQWIRRERDWKRVLHSQYSQAGHNPAGRLERVENKKHSIPPRETE